MPPKVPPQVPPQVSPQVSKPNNPPNEVMKLKMEMAAARAEAEQKKKLQNNEMAAARAAAEQKKKLQNNQMAAARAAAEEKKKIHENQMAAARAAAEEKTQMLMEQMIAARAAAEEKKQMLREQVMAARAAAEEKKQMLKEEQMLKNELAAVGNEMLGDEPVMDENIDLEGFTLDEMVLGDEPVLDFETGPEDSRTLPTDITSASGPGGAQYGDWLKYDTKRGELLNLNSELSFENAASTQYLTDNMKKMIGLDSSFNARYSPMTNFFGSDYVSVLADTAQNAEYRVARKFNDEIMPKYLNLYYPQHTNNNGEENKALDTKFPTHNYFPDMKDVYEDSEIFKILDIMPKGGILHIHSGALMDIDWVLSNHDGKKEGLLMDLPGDYGFFVNNDTINNQTDIYKPNKISEKLFTSFKRGTWNQIAPKVESNGVRNMPTYNQVTNIYTDASGVNWLDLTAKSITSSKKPAYTEAVQKNIRRCLTIVGDDDPNSCAAYDIPKIWEVFELLNARWSSLRDAGDSTHNPLFNFLNGLPGGWSAHLFAHGMKVVYDNKIQHIDIRLNFAGDWKTLENIDAFPIGSLVRANEAKRIQENLVEKTRKKIQDYLDALTILEFLLGEEATLAAGPGAAPIRKSVKDFTIRFILCCPRSVSMSYSDYQLVAAFMLKCGITYTPRASTGMVVQDKTIPGPLDTILNRTSAWLGTCRRGTIPDASGGKFLYDLITGYDMIREEDRFNKTDYYFQTFLRVNEIELSFWEAIGSGLGKNKMDFFFHDGESNWHTNYNVVDAVMLGSKRIGHGFNVDMRPGVVAKAIRDNICFEISPLSNQILQYTPDIRAHYANGLFRQGLPMVISNDDPIMYGYNGLTYDFFAAAVSWNLSYKAIKRLAWSSIQYSTLSDVAKPAAKAQFTTMWKTWINKILVAYNMTPTSVVPIYMNPIDMVTYRRVVPQTPITRAEYINLCC